MTMTSRRELTVLKVQEIPSATTRALCDRAAEDRRARRHEGAGVDRLSARTSRGTASGTLYLYAYGAYGYAIPPGFSTGRLSLLDRGLAFAIAHIRGGDDLGQQWYLDGKLEKRTNTFNDFVDVANGLIDGGCDHGGRDRDRRAARPAAS